MSEKKDLPQILGEAKEKLPNPMDYKSGASVSVKVFSGDKTIKVVFTRTSKDLPPGWQGGTVKK